MYRLIAIALVFVAACGPDGSGGGSDAVNGGGVSSTDAATFELPAECQYVGIRVAVVSGSDAPDGCAEDTRACADGMLPECDFVYSYQGDAGPRVVAWSGCSLRPGASDLVIIYVDGWAYANMYRCP